MSETAVAMGLAGLGFGLLIISGIEWDYPMSLSIFRAGLGCLLFSIAMLLASRL